MKKTVLALLALIAVTGCGPRPGNEASRTAIPVDLSVEVNDKQMTLGWRKRGDGAIAGYNIYISREPLAVKYPGPSIDASIETFNTTPFPGDTNPEDGFVHFDAVNLENGVKFYVSVRVVYPDRSVSKPSREVAVVCGPRGEIELTVRYQSDRDGYSFEQNSYVGADDSNNDLYFFSKDGVDYLDSPRRLNGFIRDTRFLVLPFSGSYTEISAQVANTKLTATADRVAILPGDWLLLRCEGVAHALVEVKEIEGIGETRVVKLWFAYSALVGEVFF